MTTCLSVPFVNLPRQYHLLRDEMRSLFDRVASSGSYILGPDLVAFEEEVAAYCEAKYALGVANCTDAISIALRALEVGPGDEVITVPNSFIGTAGAIISVGAMPRFVDVLEDLNIDPKKIRAAITKNTKAIIPVHLTGRPAAMDEVKRIAKECNLYVIEDAAQAIGAKYKGCSVGSFGDIGCFSLHPLKNLGILGDGGFITTNREDIFQKIHKIRNHGLRNRDQCDLWGQNSRLDNIQATFCRLKLKHLPQWTKRVREIAKEYQEALKNYIRVPIDTKDEWAVYHNFMIQTEDRDELKQYLNQRGIDTKIHYPILLHLQPAAINLGYGKGSFPVAERLVNRILSLPIYPELQEKEILAVVQGIRDFFDIYKIKEH